MTGYVAVRARLSNSECRYLRWQMQSWGTQSSCRSIRRCSWLISCSAYIRPSGNHFEIDNEDTGTALLWRKDATEGEEIEDYESCEKFVTKTALFTGVFVGVTWLCTELFCEWNDPPYGRSGFQCSSINPKPFAIVYYAENKKRLVPMDSIEKVER